ncbi:TadE/TadG family type IV pilus assembly protein [Photobacterium nomapromontoriensis]|uniref:TadE/TadG family type IV pilus assembly protein n=1 Tax=Photobacterium nomapromontoriensis TaxID=2910237 RepID=UPI003D1449B1
MMKIPSVTAIRYEQGVAAIWMVMTLVPVMGFTFWAVEGTRYVQERSRLEDASEAAVLAVTMEDSPLEGKANVMAEDYVRAYVRDIEQVQVDVQRQYIEADPDENILEYVQYTVDATTTHESWFSNTLIPSFDHTEDIVGRSIAKRYPEYLGGKSIDIVFVSDFSGSMNSQWQGHSQLYWLKDAITKISEKFLIEGDDDNEVKNRMAFVPYNLRVQDEIDNTLICNSQLRYNNHNSHVSNLDYESVDWSFWSTYNSTSLYYCRVNYNYCPGRNYTERRYRQQEARRINDVMQMYYSNYLLDHPSYIDYSNTVNDMFNNKVDSKEFHYNRSANNLYSRYICTSGNNAFSTINLTTNSDTIIDGIANMGAYGGTSSYQGILRGAQVLAAGQQTSNDQDEIDAYNARLKMLLVMSDGQESPYGSILSNLVDAGMCDRLREEFSDSETALYIGVIGINFNASDQSGFQGCVLNPEEDIIDVDRVEDLIDKIEELIKKGSQSNGTTRLYG